MKSWGNSYYTTMTHSTIRWITVEQSTFKTVPSLSKARKRVERVERVYLSNDSLSLRYPAITFIAYLGYTSHGSMYSRSTPCHSPLDIFPTLVKKEVRLYPSLTLTLGHWSLEGSSGLTFSRLFSGSLLMPLRYTLLLKTLKRRLRVITSRHRGMIHCYNCK